MEDNFIERNLQDVAIEMGSPQTNARRIQNYQLNDQRNALWTACFQLLSFTATQLKQNCLGLRQKLYRQLLGNPLFIQKHNIYLSPLPILASKCIVINSQSHFKILEG